MNDFCLIPGQGLKALHLDPNDQTSESLRGCLHDTMATFAPARLHSGSLSWLYIFVYVIPPQNVMPARVTLA